MSELRCRYGEKRMYPTYELALDGALAIKARCALEHRSYQELHPYKCPDEPHWHLSHYEQGMRLCGTCSQVVPAWKGWWWVISRHDHGYTPCKGEGSRAADDQESDGTSCAG